MGASLSHSSATMSPRLVLILTVVICGPPSRGTPAAPSPACCASAGPGVSAAGASGSATSTGAGSVGSMAERGGSGAITISSAGGFAQPPRGSATRIMAMAAAMSPSLHT